MTKEETVQLLKDAVMGAASPETVREWLEEQGIDEEVFRSFLDKCLDGHENKMQAMVTYGAGFHVGWMAHQLSLKMGRNGT